MPGSGLLAHELRDLAAVLVHDVMGAHLRRRIVEPAPAARVVALAGVDDDHVRHTGRVRGALIEVGRRPPDGGWKVGRTGRVWRRARRGCWCRSRDGPEVSNAPSTEGNPTEAH